MHRRRNGIIAIISAICSIALIYAVYQLQLKQIDLQKTTTVVVPSRFIPAGTMLEQDMLKRVPIYTSALHSDMVTHLEAIVGMETLMPLGEAEPVLQWKIGSFQLLPGRLQATFQIPRDYILSISDGIRAGDLVRIYVSDLTGSSKRLFDEDIRVASVKTASNTEVEDSSASHILSKVRNNHEHIYASRRDANAPIEHINLNLTEEQWLLIDRQCMDGTAKLVIAFTSSSMVDASS